MTLRATWALVLGSLIAAAPAAATGMPDGTATVAATEFRETYGSDAIVRFRPDGRGATFLGAFRTDPLASDPLEASWRFLEREAFILGLTDPRAVLRVDRVTHWREWVVVRFGQTAYGRPVLHQGFVVVADADGRVYQVAGSVADVSTVAPSTLLSPEQAVAALQAIVPAAKVESLEPAVLADGDAAVFVYVAEVQSGGPLDRFEVVEDATTGRPLAARRLFVSALGSVYDPNPVVNPTVQNVELLGLTSTTNLVGNYAESWACNGTRCATFTRRAVPDVAGDYIYTPLDPSFTDAFAEVQGYYHMDKVNRFFNDSLTYAFSCGGSNAMKIFVNLDYANAYYGDMDHDRCGDVVMGQGAVIDFAYDADVIYHEFTHGIVDDTAGLGGWAVDSLGPDFSSGGLNEGTADYFSVTLSGDSRLGEYSAREGMMGELDIREAVNDFTCPRKLTGESHYDGRIWLGTTWEIRASIGAVKTDQLVMSTLLALSSEADFDEAGNALISAAARLVGTGVLTAADQAEVDRVVNARGLPGCIRIIDLYDPATGEASVGQAFSMGLEEMGGYMDEMASGIQFRIRTPPTAARVSLAIHPATIVEANAYDVYMRQDAAVHFSFASWSLTIDGYDAIATGNPDGFTMAGWSTPPLVPGADYYFTFVHRNPTAVLLSFTASVALGPPRPEAGDGGDSDAEVVEDVPEEEATPEVEPDIVVPDVEPDVVADTEPDAPADTGTAVTVGGGCSCRTIPAGPSGLFAALLFAAALLFRRRG